MRVRGLLVVAAFAYGCGSGSPLTVEQWRKRANEETCDWWVRCGLLDHQADCQEFFEFDPSDPQLPSLVENGSVIFDPDAAQECLEYRQTQSCRRESFEEAPAACEGTLVGTLGAGATCWFSVQCASEYCNTPTCADQCCTGSCAMLPAAGQPCAEFSCADGAYCDYLDSGNCMQLKEVDASCARLGECRPGLSCTATVGSPGACVVAPERGEPCIADSGLGFFACSEWGLVCNPGEDLCVTAPSLGDVCNSSNDVCPWHSSWCDPASNTCSELPGPGEPCRNAGCWPDSTCVFDDVAMASVCSARRSDGDSCDSDLSCLSAHCNPSTLTCGQPPLCQ